MVLVQQVTKNAKAMVPFLKPIWAFGIAFSVTGYLIWKLPITGIIKYPYTTCVIPLYPSD
jgi:hypothetical protein